MRTLRHPWWARFPIRARADANDPRSQRGVFIVLAAVGTVVLLGGAMITIDVAHVTAVREQLQNAVDAAALAGAQGLMTQPGNYTTGGRAVQLAMQYAAANRVAGQALELGSGEITFPQPNLIKIDIRRRARTFFAGAVGLGQISIRVQSAAAVASLTSGGGPGSWRPWALMDQFGHGSICVGPPNAQVDGRSHGDFNDKPHVWRGVYVDSDRYVSPYDKSLAGLDLSGETDCSLVTGFITPRDVMINDQTISLKTSGWLTPGHFGTIALGGSAHAKYRQVIQDGWDGLLGIGELLEIETGNTEAATVEGINDLVARDPSAEIQKDKTGRWVVVSNTYPLNESPRIVPLPLYSPLDRARDGSAVLSVRSFGAFFVQSAVSGKEIRGTFIGLLMHAAEPDGIVATSSRTSGAGGQLLGTTTLTDPEKYSGLR